MVLKNEGFSVTKNNLNKNHLSKSFFDQLPCILKFIFKIHNFKKVIYFGIKKKTQKNTIKFTGVVVIIFGNGLTEPTARHSLNCRTYYNIETFSI